MQLRGAFPPTARPELLTWRRGLLALAALGAVVLVERAPPQKPWLDPIPAYAHSQGYDKFYRSQGGWGLPRVQRSWIQWAPPRPEGPVLIDQRHAHKQPFDSRLALEAYRYSDMHGLARAFEPLRRAGVPLLPTTSRLTGPRLAGASAIFMNLPSGNGPGLTHGEVVAIEAFVAAGGGLVIVTDHSNCYFHAELLQPLADAFGFRLPTVTATDQGTGNTLSPNSKTWIAVRPVAEHPVTEGVEVVGMTTAGEIQIEPGTAGQELVATSGQGWADAWTPYRRDDSVGFTGNLKKDDDEPSRSVSVVAALTHEQGRVVVIADQNALGATMIGFEDNARLFANAMAWATDREVPVETRGRDSVVTLAGKAYACGTASPPGFRTLQVQMARLSAHLDVPEFCSADRLGKARGVVLLPTADPSSVEEVLVPGRRVLVPLQTHSEAHRKLIERLGLTLGNQVEAPGSTFGWVVEPPPAPDHRIFRTDEVVDRTSQPLRSEPIAVSGEFSTWAVDDLGRPLVIRCEVGGAEVLLMLDGDLLSNEAMGQERTKPWKGAPEQATAHRLALRLLSWVFSMDLSDTPDAAASD